MAKQLGVIGGLGPGASAYFYELITLMTDAGNDQEHIDINIISKPSIPDRTAYILGRSNDSPLNLMIEVGKSLDLLGVDYIAIPCITAHYFHKELSCNIKAPIIHIIKETVKCLKCHGVESAGIMATEGTIASNLFQHELVQKGIRPIVPSKGGQELITSIIYEYVKVGKAVNMDYFHEVTDELDKMGADTNILGCTELSLVKRDESIGSGFIDAMEVLAKASIINCQAALKKEYINLIT